MKISLSDTWCPNCGTQVVTMDSYKILTPKFLYRLLVSVGCRFMIEDPKFAYILLVQV